MRPAVGTEALHPRARRRRRGILLIATAAGGSPNAGTALFASGIGIAATVSAAAREAVGTRLVLRGLRRSLSEADDGDWPEAGRGSAFRELFDPFAIQRRSLGVVLLLDRQTARKALSLEEFAHGLVASDTHDFHFLQPNRHNASE